MDKKTEINKQSADRKPGKSRFLTTFVCIFLAIVVVFGGVVGVITAVRDARAVAKYSDVMLDEGEVIYLASRYKTMYLASLSSAGIAAGDSPVFWAKKAADGKTYGEHFNEGFREYIASVIVANYLYSSYTSYSTEDQRIVAASIEEILTLKADGSVAKFNELTEKYGFDYMDFEVATEMLYRAETAKSVIYGNGGTGLASFPDECNEFLKKYSHVSLLFVRDATRS